MNCLTKIQLIFLLFCMIHGSAVLGCDQDEITIQKKIRIAKIRIARQKRCEKEIYSLFPQDESGAQHFVRATQDYNWRYFCNPVNKYNASGYFEELIKMYERSDVHFHFPPPSEFCAGNTDKPNCHDALYMIFAEKHLDYEDELARILTRFSGYKAFKYVYRKIIFSRITFDNVYPKLNKSKPTLEMYRSDVTEYNQALEIWSEEVAHKNIIIGYMEDYLDDILQFANEIARCGEDEEAISEDEDPILKRCKKQIHRIFPKDESPGEHFIRAFQDFNWRYFCDPINNYKASGYFEELLTSYEQSSFYIRFPPPSEFCDDSTEKSNCYDALYMIFAEKHLNYNDELERILSNYSGYQAFKFVYRTIIFSRITFDRVYPKLNKSKPTLEKYRSDVTKYNQALEIWTEEVAHRNKIIGFMEDYLQYTLQFAHQIAAQVTFVNVTKYCEEHATE